MAEATNTQLAQAGLAESPASATANPLQKSLQSDVAKKLGMMVGLAASIALGFAVVLWSMQPNYSLLYGNLSENDAQSIVDALQAQGVEYKLDSATGAVMVPADTLHDIRLKMAAEGLPRGTGIGFESLQQDSGFGTSQFIETARYHRSLEVELARTISNINTIESARVHLAMPKSSVFIRDRQKPSASVTVKLHQGRILEENQISAITHLVASGVPNMEASSVTVVDQKGNLLSGKKRSSELAQSTDQLEYVQRLEQRYAERINNILMPIVGRNGVEAQVVADVDFTITEQTQELFNPDAPALRSQQQSEERSSGVLGGGIPGALANQPPADAVAPEQVTTTDGSSQSPSSSKSRSTANYELDKTISHTRIAPGRVKRLSVAVVVDDRLLNNGERRSHSPEEVERMIGLVKDAVGFDVQRGDSVSFTNIAFSDPQPLEALPDAPLWEEPWVYDLGKYLVAALALLMIYIGLLRPVMRGLFPSPEDIERAREAERKAEAPTATLAGIDLENLTPEQRQALLEAGGEKSTILLPPKRSHEDQLNDVRRIVEDEPQLVAEVLKGWLEADEK